MEMMEFFDRFPSESWGQVTHRLFMGDYDAWRSPEWVNRDDAVYVDLSGAPRMMPVDDLDGRLRVTLPIDDGEMRDPVLVRAVAKMVAELTASHDVLVMCAAGLNRSGLVVARALMELGDTSDEAIERVRAVRGPVSLSNPAFVAWLHREDPMSLAYQLAEAEGA